MKGSFPFLLGWRGSNEKGALRPLRADWGVNKFSELWSNQLVDCVALQGISLKTKIGFDETIFSLLLLPAGNNRCHTDNQIIVKLVNLVKSLCSTTRPVSKSWVKQQKMASLTLPTHSNVKSSCWIQKNRDDLFLRCWSRLVRDIWYWNKAVKVYADDDDCFCE